VDGLHADVARLVLGVVHALLDRDCYGLSIIRICIILLGTASFLDILAKLVVAALVPVLFLACRATVACLAAAALLGQTWKRGSAAGALRDDHC
jgi:hypothetical protein